MCTFMRCGHLTYDPWIWLKVTSLSSTASVLNECKKIYATESLNVHNVKILSIFFQRFWLVHAFLLRMKACTWHIEWFPWHQEPQRPQWPQQPQWPQWPQWPQQPHFIKKLTEHDVANYLATKWPVLVSQCGMAHQNPLFYGFLALFLLEAVEAMDVTFNQIQGS